MYKGLSNPVNLLICAGLFFGSYACNSGKANQQESAEKMLSDAQSMYEKKQYDQAISAIDSLMKKYPGIFDVQRDAMHLKTLIVEQKTILDSIANDSIISSLKTTVDALSPKFKFVKTSDMVEGYYVLNSIPLNNLAKRTSIEARIDERGQIYLTSSLYGHPIKHTFLKAEAGGETMSTKPVPFDNAKNYRFKDGRTPVEMVTFSKEACDTFCMFIAKQENQNIRLSFCGNRAYSIAMSPALKHGIAETYTYAVAKDSLRHVENLKLFYAKKLQITRKQSRQTAQNMSDTQKK